MPDLGILGLEFLKTIVIFEINTLKFVKNEPLTHTVNLGIGSAFSKGPVPVPGTLYKICLVRQLYLWDCKHANDRLSWC